MAGRIVVGQYIPGNSLFHSFSALSKIISTFASACAVVIMPGYWGMLVSMSYVLLVMLLTGKTALYALRGLRPLMWLLILTFVFQCLVIPGETLFKVGIFQVSKTGLIKGVMSMGKLVLLILLTSLLTLTTSPLAITRGLEKILHPLKKVGVPANELAMMLSIALSFIPTILDEAEKVMQAQKSRGASFNRGNIFNRLQTILPFIVPLLVGTLERAEELAMAMESRCYVPGARRTQMNQVMLASKDYMMIFVAGFFFMLAVAMRISGGWTN